jgi:hypothetical protein
LGAELSDSSIIVLSLLSRLHVAESTKYSAGTPVLSRTSP